LFFQSLNDCLDGQENFIVYNFELAFVWSWLICLGETEVVLSSGIIYKLIKELSWKFTLMNANGPAIWGGCVTRRKHRPRPVFFSQKTVTVQGRCGACFCSPGTRFYEHYACRGTKLNASHIFIPGYKLNALQWRGPELSPVTKLSWVQE
jgi:hypothetical protein